MDQTAGTAEPMDRAVVELSGGLLPFRGQHPRLAKDVFIAAGAIVIGDVEIGAASSVWFNCVIRGDVGRIRIGDRTSIQDLTMIHCSGLGASWPTLIGDEVTVGHMAMVHGCTIGDRCLIGMRAVVLDGATIESGAVVAAGALVPPGTRVPQGEVWAGVPARRMRGIAEAEELGNKELAHLYAALGQEYAEMDMARLSQQTAELP